MFNDDERVCLSLTEVTTYVWHNITRREANELLTRIHANGIENEFGEVEWDPEFLESAEVEDITYEAVEMRLSAHHHNQDIDLRGVADAEIPDEDPEMKHIRKLMGNGPQA